MATRRQFLAAGLSIGTSLLFRRKSYGDHSLEEILPTSLGDPRIQTAFSSLGSFGTLFSPPENDPLEASGIDLDRKVFRRLRSIAVFEQLPYQEISDRLGLGKKDTVRILYPGAGCHLAPLEMAIRLQSLTPNLTGAEFTYTETDRDAPDQFVIGLNLVEKSGAQVDYISTLRPGCGGPEITYSINLFGKHMRVRYLIGKNFEDNGDHPYFRQQDAREADIFLFHDSFQYHDEVAEAVLYAMRITAASEDPKVIIFDATRHTHFRHALNALPGNVVMVEGKYGCFGTGAVVYFPDNRKVQELLASQQEATTLEATLKNSY